jgi:hypothetical protein
MRPCEDAVVLNCARTIHEIIRIDSDLERKDRQEQARNRLRALIEEGTVR